MIINLLDMGRTRYGDCILIQHNNKRVLIDGAHPREEEFIQDQLSQLIPGNPPYKIDLLIVTHCHSDHIGCLPALVSNNVLDIKTALVADENYGWGRDANGDGPGSLATTANQRALVNALMEEDHSDLPDDELAEFLSDAENLEQAYNRMLGELENMGTNVVRFKGVDATKDLQKIEKAFKEIGLKIIGPTEEHLLRCTHVLATVGSDTLKSFEDFMSDTADNFDVHKLITKYRQQAEILSDAAFAEDRPGPGAAKNNQSIVLKVADDEWAALLAGDMQYAKPEVSGLNDIMKKLFADSNKQGPYHFIKLTHHTSYNGLDSNILKPWLDQNPQKGQGEKMLFAHTGGVHDASHPDRGALKTLKAFSRDLQLARTDRNGIITVKKNGALVGFEISKGRLNDFTPNELDDTPVTNEETHAIEEPKVEVPVQAIEAANEGDQFVEVITRIPHKQTKVTVSIEIDPGTEKKKIEQPQITSFSSDTARFAGLVFLTSSSILARNIGSTESARILNYLKGISQALVVDVPELKKAEDVVKILRSKISASTKGVVIIGGYDVIPSKAVSAIDKNLRRKLEEIGRGGYDADDFIVWNDDIYGDLDGDLLPEIPVSRIPDGRRADLVTNALNSDGFKTGSRFGVRNLKRPFANNVFGTVPGQQSILNISETFGPRHIAQDIAKGAVYYMLHGSDRDGTRFWGETNGGVAYEAFNIASIPKSAANTVVFAGCCWGALTVSQPAAFADSGFVQPRVPEQSIALSYLLAGAHAFVGCTGSHYSPLAPPYNYFGKPMHDGFWKAINGGMKPAEALLYAKKEYAKQIPHGQQDPFSQAVELKIFRQYTCLGLGW